MGEGNGVWAVEGKAGVDETDAALDDGEIGLCFLKAGIGGEEEPLLLTGSRGD